MKGIVLIILVLFTGQMYCYYSYGEIFLAMEPSSINIAMGETVGVVNIWHNNPLTFYANPAIAALHEGISYGYKRDVWLEENFDDVYYSGGLISFGYKGISLTLPAYNGSKRLGLDFEGMIEDGTSTEVSWYDNALIHNVAISPLEIYRNFFGTEEMLSNLDFNIGVSYENITVYYPSETWSFKDNFKSINIGTLARYTNEISDYIVFEGIAGYSRFNLKESNIFNYEPVYSHNNYGVASSFSFPAVNYDIGFLDQEIFHYTNLMTYRALASYKTDPNSSSTITGFGIEGGFLDALFLRAGRHIDKDGNREGNTYGFGIKLNYKSIISLSYNYSVNRAGEHVKSQKAYDLGLSIDALRIKGL